MKITKEQIKALKPCNDGWAWYCENASHIDELKQLLLFINEYSPSKARWLFTNLMNRDQNIEIAVFAAEQVLPIYEKHFPNDKRVGECIQAVKDYEADKISLNELIEKRRATADAAYAADDAYDDFAAFAAYAAHAAAEAASYADAVADAAYAAAYAAGDGDGARKEMQERIIYKVVEILERDI